MSIKSQLQSKAAAMATSMADRARTPQEIAAIRQRVVAQIQSGELPPYIGVPLVQDLSTRLSKAQQQQAQAVAGMGIPPAPQGAPIAQQVMAQAQQPAGVEALPTNLPQSYAPGGLVAFAEGGDVERYQDKGYVYETPYDRMNRLNRERAAQEDAERIADLQARGMPTMPYKEQMSNLLGIIPEAAKTLVSAPGYGLSRLGAPTAAAATATAATPAATGPTTGDLARADRAAPTPAAAAAAPAAPSLPAFRMPQVNLATYTPGEAPAATDYQSIVGQLPAKAKSAFEEARDTEEKYLRGLTAPGEAAREERFKTREAALDKDSAMGRALSLMSLGFGIAGSKERTLAGALGREGREGIQALIQGEAANRVAKERLEDARDNFEQQKIAARKGDRTAAMAAGQRAADDLRAYTGLNMQAAQAGSQEATQRFQMSEQAKQFQVGEANRASLGLAGLNLQAQQVAQQGAIGMQQLQLGREKLQIIKDQVAAGDKRAAAALAGAETKARQLFQNSQEYRQALAQAQKMSPIDAQRFMQQEWLKYSANAVPSLFATQGGGANVPTFSDLMKAME